MALIPLETAPSPGYPRRRRALGSRGRQWLPAAALAAAVLLTPAARPALAETAEGPAPEDAPAQSETAAEPDGEQPPSGQAPPSEGAAAAPEQQSVEQPLEQPEEQPLEPPLEQPEEPVHLPGVPPPAECDRPLSEWATWIRLGGGALVRTERDEVEGLFDFGIGFDATLGLDREGDIRLGVWAEGRTRTFWSVSPRGGLEIFVGALPRGLDMFHYEGEGALSIRVGAGYSFRGEDGGLVGEGVVVTGTLAYGYRAPWNLWNPFGRCHCDLPPCRAPARYMIPVRLYVAAEGGVTEDRFWQVTGGLEFEPIGSFRYLLGMV